MDDDERSRDRVELEQAEELKAALLRTRGDLFARILGESWRSDGDGIYRQVSELYGRTVSPHAQNNRRASRIRDELPGALAPHRRQLRDEDQPPAEQAHPAEAPRERGL